MTARRHRNRTQADGGNDDKSDSRQLEHFCQLTSQLEFVNKSGASEKMETGKKRSTSGVRMLSADPTAMAVYEPRTSHSPSCCSVKPPDEVFMPAENGPAPITP